MKKKAGFQGECNWAQIFGHGNSCLTRNCGGFGLGWIVREHGGSLRRDQTLRGEKEQGMVGGGRWNRND